MNIRQYTSEDIEAVVAVFRSNIPKYFGPVEEPGLREFLSTARSDEYFVFEIGDNVVGSGGIALNSDDTVSLCWGMICKEHLGTGLGRRMTQFRIDLSREKYPGVPMVISTSQHTRGFYEKFGFRLIERFPDGFGPGIDTCTMRLDLS